MTVQITIIGLGQIGSSIGLALAAHKDRVTRVGNDRDPQVSRQAEKLGALDKVDYNLPSAVEKADAVILTEPVDQLRKTLEVIAPVLRPGCVVIDTSPVKVAVAAWASELLPAERHFISLSLSLNPLYLLDADDTAHADLFKDALAFITGPSGAPEAALQFASDLANLLGAKPFFADPYELDGLLAASHLLPRLAAAALLNTAMDEPGWAEARKLAGPVFAQTTQAADLPEGHAALSRSALLNRENTLRMLDQYMAALQSLRAQIEQQDEEGLQKRLEQAHIRRQTWLEQRKKSSWEPVIKADVPTTGEMLGRLIGLPRKDKK